MNTKTSAKSWSIAAVAIMCLSLSACGGGLKSNHNLEFNIPEEKAARLYSKADPNISKVNLTDGPNDAFGGHYEGGRPKTFNSGFDGTGTVWVEGGKPYIVKLFCRASTGSMFKGSKKTVRYFKVTPQPGDLVTFYLPNKDDSVMRTYPECNIAVKGVEQYEELPISTARKELEKLKENKNNKKTEDKMGKDGNGLSTIKTNSEPTEQGEGKKTMSAPMTW